MSEKHVNKFIEEYGSRNYYERGGYLKSLGLATSPEDMIGVVRLIVYVIKLMRKK